MSKIFSTKEKFIALLLAVVMIVGMIPFSAVASYGDTTMVKHQGSTLYYDDAGKPVTDPDKINNGEWAVKLSKTAVETDVENEFEITLTVEARDGSLVKPRTEPIPVDVVLVFDLSGSMDQNSNAYWNALKTAAASFIDNIYTPVNGVQPNIRLSIVAYGGSSQSTSITNNNGSQYKTIQEWTKSATTAKSSFNSNNTALSLWGGTSSQYTNCQAGFYSADVMLNSFTSGVNSVRPTAGELQYVVYMSDGVANTHYYKWQQTRPAGTGSSSWSTTASSPVGGEGIGSGSYTLLPYGGLTIDRERTATVPGLREGLRVSQGSTNGTAVAENAAIAQAGVLKSNNTGVKLYTVGLGVDNSKVLKKGTSNNQYVDEYFYGTQITLGNIYKTISDTIRLESTPWTVLDNMSSYVKFDPSSTVTPAKYIKSTSASLEWDIAAQTKDEGAITTYTATYTVNLDMSNISVWENNRANPTNDRTALTFNVYEGGEYTKTTTVEFDVPTVRANLYTYTFEYYLNGVLQSAQTIVEKHAVGDTLDISDAEHQKSFVNHRLIDVTMNENTMTLPLSNADKIVTGKGTSGTVVKYYYTNGYPLTINYLESGTENVLANPHTGIYAVGATYSVDSPSSIAGYKLVNAANSTVSGTKLAQSEVINVYYEKIAYRATYRFVGDTPDGVTAPTDSNPYYYDDYITVADNPSATGWTFNGWKVAGEAVSAEYGPVRSNIEFVGTWTINSYMLDVVYKFASLDDYNDFQAYRDEADDADAYIAAIEAVVGEFMLSYTSANGTEYSNVFVYQQPQSKNYGASYSFTAETDIPDFKSAGTKSGTISGNTTVEFELFNDLFVITIKHDKLAKSGSYVTADTDLLYRRSGEAYSVTEKTYTGFHVSDGEAIGDYTCEGDATYTIQYDPDTYNVDFAFVTTDNPSSVAVPDAQIGVWYGDTAVDPAIIAPTGWTFKGWYTDEDLENKYDFNTPVTEDITLYGGWSRIEYTVTFNVTYADDGYAGTEIGGKLIPSTPNIQKKNYGDYADDPAYLPDFLEDLSVTFTFDGWYLNDDFSGDPYVFEDNAITDNVILYGKWTKEALTYGYIVEHYLDGVKFETKDGIGGNLEYGAVITDASAINEKLGKTAEGLGAYFDYYEYINDNVTATGCKITEVKENNIVKIYYTTNTYKLTIEYIYQSHTNDALVNTAVFASHESTRVYNSNFSVDAPSAVENFTASNYVNNEWTLANAALTYPTGVVNVAGKMPGQDITLTVLYDINPQYTYKINYLELGTNKVIDEQYVSHPIFINNPYSIDAAQTSEHAITNYTFYSLDGALAGNMPEGGVTVNVYYTRDQASLTVNHFYVNSAEPFAKTTDSYNVGDAYAAAPAAPEGYKLLRWNSDNTETAFDASANASGVMPGEGVTVNYFYGLSGKVYVTVMYWDEFDNEIHDAEVEAFDTFSAYDMSAYTYATLGDFDQYTFNHDDADGTYQGNLTTMDITINRYYVTGQYMYEVHFINDYTRTTIEEVSGDNLMAPWGMTLNSDKVAADLDDADWIMSRLPSGYFLNGVSYPTISVEGNIVEVHYNYIPYNPDPLTFTVTVEYYAGDQSIANARTRSYTTYSGQYTYNVQDYLENTIGDYTLIPGSYVLTGTADGNVTIRLQYELPLIPPPEIEEFEEEEGPLAAFEAPEVDGDEEVEFTEEVPLSDMPQTGLDDSNAGFWMFGLMASLMAAGALVTTIITNRKSKKQ